MVKVIGKYVDHIAGAGSRLLHIRSAKHNTVPDLEPYLDLSAAELFPAPRPIENIKETRTPIDRLLKSSTLSWRSTHDVVCDTYRARHEGRYKRNLTAWARWVRPDNAPRKTCIVYVHGWLEPGSWVEELSLFRKWSRELGVDMVHVALPFHGRRNPLGSLFSGEFFWTADLVRSIEGVRQAVCDARAMIAWLRGQGYDQVGVSGISLGGSITMLLACVAPSADFAIPIVSHLELSDAVETASILFRMKSDLEKWGIDQGQRRALFDRMGLAAYRPVLPPDRQLWIQAEEDMYIDADLVRKQWEDWGHPQIMWIPGGHMTFPLHVSAFTDRIADFLA